MTQTPVQVGLVGAGMWASWFHAPMWAGEPGVTLAGIWARNPESAHKLAAEHGTRTFASFDELLDSCDAVSFAVPPDVQAPLALRAAAAGRHVLLDKPLGLTLDESKKVADAIADAGVMSVLTLTNRFNPAVRAFLANAQETSPFAAQMTFLSGGNLPGGTYAASAWRVREGALPDLGPHVLDLFETLLGPIVSLTGSGERTGMVRLDAEHSSGGTSQALLSATSPVNDLVFRLTVVGTDGENELRQPMSGLQPGTRATLAAEFVASIQTMTPHPLGAERGRALAELLDQAGRTLR